MGADRTLGACLGDGGKTIKYPQDEGARMQFSAVIHREGEYFVATCPEVNFVTSQGRTLEEALENIREAVELYLEGEEEPRSPEPVMIAILETRDQRPA